MPDSVPKDEAFQSIYNIKDIKCLSAEELHFPQYLFQFITSQPHKADCDLMNKEESILEELYRDHSKRLVGYVYHFLRSQNEAEEVAQEAFLKLHSAKNSEEIISHKAFLYRIAHNLAMKTLRRRKIVTFDTGIDMEEMEVESNEPLADQQLSSKQEYKLFCEAVEQLPPKCQQAFTLRVIYKKSFKEISDELGIAISTAEKHVLRGMRDCQDYMEKAKNKQKMVVATQKIKLQSRPE